MIIKPIIPLILMIIISIVLVILICTSSKGMKLVNRLLIVLVIFVINLRPMVPNGNVEVVSNNLDIMFVIDTTLSMEAFDYQDGKTRLEGVKQDVDYILNKIPGANYSVITFDNKSVIKLPLTFDSNAIHASVATLKTPDHYYAKGSTITLFKKDLKKLLQKSREKDNRYTVVFLFTDGENNSKQKLEKLSDLKKLIDGGAVLGYGTTKGSKMKYTNYQGETEYIEDRSSYPYKDAISKMDEKNMKNMAKDMGIDYIYMNKSSAIDSKLKSLIKLKNNVGSSTEHAYSDIYFYISPILILLFIIEISLDRRGKIWKE